MKKIMLIISLLSVFAITNAQVNENKTLDIDSVQKNELKIPPRATEMVITQLKNEPVEKFYRYGMKNKEQLENLQLGRAIREYTIDNDTLMPLGWRAPLMYEGKPFFLAYVTGRGVRFGAPMMGEDIHHYERKDLMGILMVKPLPTEYYYIRRENKDVFLQVFDPATRKYFMNEYSLPEIINLRNRTVEVHANPTKEGWQEIYGTNAPVDEKDIFDTNFPQKHELKMTPEITKMLTNEIYWQKINDSDWSLSNFGITNRAQLENLQLGKPIPGYLPNIDNENLIFTGTWHVLVMSDGEPLFISKVSEGKEQYSYTGGGGAGGMAKVLHNYEHKDLIIGFLGALREWDYFIIRKEHQDIFVQVRDKATGERFKEYTLSEIINLLKK